MGKQLAQLLVILALIGALCVTAQPAHAGASIITVNTDEATGTVNGNCDLTEAIEAANYDEAVDGCAAGFGLDTIAFNIGASGSSHTIVPGGELQIVAPVIIDGTTQPGYAGVPLIRVDGQSLTTHGFFFTTGGPSVSSAGSVLRGLMITRYTLAAVRIVVGNASEHVTLTGNYIGTDGTNDLGSNRGVELTGAQYAQIGGPSVADRNVISGNDYGVVLYGGADYNTIQGNFIGLNASGTAAVTGSSIGVDLKTVGSGASYNLVKGNVIAGMLNFGIRVADAGEIGNVIQSNYIGTNAAGTAALGGIVMYGIALSNGDGTLIGGSAPGQGNLISGVQYAIVVASPSTNTKILGNRIGTDKDGMAAVPNTEGGIYVGDAVANIGDVLTPGNNLISGNAHTGIAVTGAGAAGTTIMGNTIGLNIAGSGSIPNDVGIGVTGSASARIAQNWIGTNTTFGIAFAAGGTVPSDAIPLNTNNCIVENGIGVMNLFALQQDLRGNWWGHATGPEYLSNPEGIGDSISDYVTATRWLVAPAAACGNGGGTYDGDHTAWSYTGTWIGVPVSGLYDDSLQVGAMSGGTASLTFHGSGFTLNYLRIPGWGNIGVYLDGAVAPVATINTNGPAGLLMYKSPALIPGTHTVVLKHTGAAGTMVAFDSLEVWPTLGVKSGWTIDPSNVEWNYTGTWASVPVTGLYNDTLHIGLSAGGTTSLFFNGTGFRLSYLRYPNWGTMVVIVDGSVVQVINTSGAAGIQTYDSPVLTSGPHSVILYNLGPAGKFIGIDALEIYTIMV